MVGDRRRPRGPAQGVGQKADALARQVLVTAELPESVASERASSRCHFPTDDTTLVADAFVAFHHGSAEPASSSSTSPTPASADPGLMIPETWMYGGLAAVGLGLLLLLSFLVPKPAAPLTAGDVASTYTQRSSSRSYSAAPKLEPDQALVQATDAAAKVLHRNTGLEARIARRLEGAGNSLKPAEWLLLHTGDLHRGRRGRTPVRPGQSRARAALPARRRRGPVGLPGIQAEAPTSRRSTPLSPTPCS